LDATGQYVHALSTLLHLLIPSVLSLIATSIDDACVCAHLSVAAEAQGPSKLQLIPQKLGLPQ
jgi:hypothetical protein